MAISLASVAIWLFAIIMATLLIAAVRNLGLARASTRWRGVDARVERVWLDVRQDSEDGDLYLPRISYAYDVGGKRYRSERVSYRHLGSRDVSTAAKIIDGVRLGSIIRVYYNPRKPWQAVLLKGVDISCYIEIVICVAGLGIALHLLPGL